jgi:hypothetical protein
MSHISFTKHYSAARIAAGDHINALMHEFGHGLGFRHICGNWDYQSHDTSGKCCTMHYDWHWMLDDLLDDPPPAGGTLSLEPWSGGYRGPYFCAPHIIAIRKANLEDNASLRW